MSLHTELRKLFGADILRQAREVVPSEVKASAVHAAAGALSRLKGQPGRQVELVRQMQPETAAALCRWLSEPGFWLKAGAINRQ